MRLISLRLWLMVALSSGLQVLIFPIAGPVAGWRRAICWFALVPLLAVLVGPADRAGQRGEAGRLRPVQGALLGYGCGILWYLGNCYWIYQTMNLYGGLARPIAFGILILFCLYLGLYHALFGWMVVVLRRSRMGREGALLLTPFVWVAVELARARITGLPWDLLGVAQVDSPLLTRLAPYTGAYGLSFVVVAINCLWLIRISVRERRGTRLGLTVAGLLVVLVYVYGVLRSVARPMGEASARATLLQENLEVGAANTGPQETKEQMLESFSRWSLAPARGVLDGVPELSGTRVVVTADGPATRSDLIVWPESPAPFEEQDERFRSAMSAFARSAGAPVIVDDIAFEPSSDPANRSGQAPRNRASFIAADGQFDGHYDKMHLVPFGEYVPFKRIFSFAGNLLAEAGIFEPGRDRAVFDTAGHKYGVFICYESIFADEVRQFVTGGAEVLVNISNDGWYGDTSAAWQHLDMVRMRAIENHRWVLRATNTGVTAAIDPAGRVTAAAPRHVRTAIQVRFGYEDDVTFYARHGDLFAYLCAAVSSAALAWSLFGRAKAKHPRRPDASAVMQ